MSVEVEVQHPTCGRMARMAWEPEEPQSYEQPGQPGYWYAVEPFCCPAMAESPDGGYVADDEDKVWSEMQDRAENLAQEQARAEGYDG